MPTPIHPPSEVLGRTKTRAVPNFGVCVGTQMVNPHYQPKVGLSVVCVAPAGGVSNGASTGPHDADLAAWRGSPALLKWSLGRCQPLFLVTPSLKLLDLNLAGESLARAGGDIQPLAGHFSFYDKARTADLRAFLETGGVGAAGWSYRRSDGAFVVVHVEWLPPDPTDTTEPLVALTFHPAGLDQRYVWAEFAHHFDLTRSEAAIVRRLIGGETPFVAAEALGLSIETVRTHIRRTYHKLGISSREQLFSIIAPFRIG